jgi:hypothetical protein
MRQWVVLLLAACTALPALAARKPEPRIVRDPHYGEVLYYFYQQKYFTALSHLMTAKHLGQFTYHADEAELLRGGMLLSYGVHLEAGRIFERLIAEGASPAVRDRAWFYLAKIRYQRGYLDEAGQDLARIGDSLPRELEIERRLLQAYLLMRNQQFTEAVALLKDVKDEGGWTRYARYNLGVALIRAGQADHGKMLLQQIGEQPARDEEFKALRDKANVALGYVALQAGQPEEAQRTLKRVRLEGLLSNKALLGMGWAHSALDDQEGALVFWDELRQRPVQDAAVLESLLASPYALGKLGAWRRSLEQYEQAIASYNREMQQLDESIVAIRAGRLQTFLLQEDVVEEMGWHWRLDKLPDAPETRYLALLLAGHEFQEAIKNYRDLRYLSARLEQWSGDVASYQDMLATRRQGFRERLPQVLSSKRAQDQARLQQERDRIASRLQQIEWDNDAEALATEKEQAQLTRLERIRQLMSRTPADDENWERYRLLRGLLRWDIETDYHARAWENTKALRDLDRELEETDRRRAALVHARDETPAELDAFDARIAALVPRIRADQDRARELERAQSAFLAELAVAELDAQRERLATYLTQAQFAVAQIYDRASSDESAKAPAGESPPPATETPP